MLKPDVVPYGAWPSPITSDLIVAETIRLGSALLDGDDIYWLEGRPSEAGRNVIVRLSADGAVEDVLPAPYNARTRVHEYGGAAVTVDEGVIIFANYRDQRLYRIRRGEAPEALTPPAALRYADCVVDRARGRLLCVREDHREAAGVANTIVAVSLDDGADQEVLVAGSDFYAAPRLSPDGMQLAWLSWQHPNMPWDGTELWVAELDAGGKCAHPRLVAGGSDESIFAPSWSPDGVLTFASDRNGWWNLYRWEGEGDSGTLRCLVEMEAEFGQPQWIFGLTTYAYRSADEIVCTYTHDGTDRLARLAVRGAHAGSSPLTAIETPFTSIDGIAMGDDPDRLVFRGGAPRRASALVALDLSTGSYEIIKRSARLDLDTGYLSMPEPVAYPSEDRTAYGLFYPPANKDCIAPDDELPPLLVFSHGGPTGASSSSLDLRIQFWTSRGFAVLDVNYGGSTGYGRHYRNLLRGRWGIVDVEDCANGALRLVAEGRVDGDRLAIRGGSAGGYTTLSALTFRDVFHAGASHYGVSDLETLARDTHKFESRYLDRLIGPYPERRDLYVARSPIHHLQHLNTPVIFFQGLEDQIVPPAQAEVMVTALREKGVPVAYLAFEGEQHGFRSSEYIKRALDAELYFYGRIFGFTPADEIEPVVIENLDTGDAPARGH
jgi:dipeptidyl aminopeptidase/acylaminoacyl peptidase